MKMTTIFINCLLWAALAAAQSTDIPIVTAEDLMDAFHEDAARRFEEALRENEAADSVAWVPDLEEWEETYRTSEWDAFVGAPPEGRRVGCICMDGTPQDDKGRGACAGYGGVRFWLYQNGDSIIMDPTRRHYGHPYPLSEEEKQSLSAYNEEGNQAFGSAGGRFGEDFSHIVMVMMVCLTIAYVARMYFTHNTNG